MTVLGQLHERVALNRRARVLAGHASRLIRSSGPCMDVGCGDGMLASLVQRERPDLRIIGVDTLVRPRCAIPVTEFDGVALPFADDSIDTILLIDVLHHAVQPDRLLADCARVARQIILKDHLADGWGSRKLLMFMDRVGNERHGVASPGSYRTLGEWQVAFGTLDLVVSDWIDHLKLYAWPLSVVFERKLHFMCTLRRAAEPRFSA